MLNCWEREICRILAMMTITSCNCFIIQVYVNIYQDKKFQCCFNIETILVDRSIAQLCGKVEKWH